MAEPTADEAPSRPKRPAPMTRQSSSQSHMSQSPSDKSQHRPHKVTHRHVAGGRMQRTASTGKNLGKFAKATQTQTQAQAQAQAQTQTPAGDEGRHHGRSQSGTSLSAPSSPRPGFKRNASSGAMMRHLPQAHPHAAHTGLRKNQSSGHLVGKAKGGKSSKDVALPRKLGNPTRSRPPSPEERSIVHFDVGNDGEHDEDEHDEAGWTEESASQSPNTTRSNTRSNSVAADVQKAVDDTTESNTRANARDTWPLQPPPQSLPAALPHRAPSHHTPSHHVPSHHAPSHHSRPPDADLITSRLLQRSASHTPAPQASSVSATVASTAARAHQLSTSVASTLVDTPGRDLVSRFIDGHGSAGTPHDGHYMLAPRASLDKSRRNKSMSNFNDVDDDDDDTPTRPHSVKSGATTPNLFPPINNRTQNKLLLQRAASAIEPHAPVPAILRSGGPSFHNINLAYNSGEGRLDPRLQQQFNQVAIEYRVVQRYRNPLADSLTRLQQMPAVLRKLRAVGESDDRREQGEVEAQELCRRMWECTEVVGGD